jgi:carboxymethylenebutenolidase
MSGEEIVIGGVDGSFAGYLATPATGRGPGVVVIQEIFGINPWIREVADWYAAQGYMAVAPDLFWRMTPGLQLDPTIAAQFEEGLGYYRRFDVDKGVEDIQATISALRRMQGCSGKVGNLGFCLGGLLSYLAAARTDTDASSSYYGGGVHTKQDEAPKVAAPTMLHLAGNDSFVPPEANDAIVAGTKANPNIAVHVYPGMPHAFCRANDPRHFNADACAQAHGRTLSLFKTALA